MPFSITRSLPVLDVTYHPHPPGPLAAYAVKPMTRAQLEAATKGRVGSWPNSVDSIDRIVAAWDAIRCIDERRREDGTLSDADQLERDTREAPIASWYRAIGLYPAASR